MPARFLIAGAVVPLLPLAVRKRVVLELGSRSFLARSFLVAELLGDLARKDPAEYHRFLWENHVGGPAHAKTYEIPQRFGDENLRSSRRELFQFLCPCLKQCGTDPERDVRSVFDVELADKAFREIESFGVWLDKEPTQTVWFHNVLVSLISALVREYRSLVIGYKKSTPLLAWVCRNMLELNIYTKYALIKGSNARDFVDDRWIDAIEIFEPFRNWVRFHDPGTLTPGIDETIRNFETEKAKQGITRTGYLRMKKMASDVNSREDYEHMNKVASKLIHPTAFSVLGAFDEGELAELKPILFNSGLRFGVQAFNEIKQYVMKNGVEPLP